MYKLLLCWRYLRTRYIALASIVSVTLGVATMIVVNSVMSGFSHEMKSRIHGILSDVVFESHSFNGFPDAEYHMEQIRRIAGKYILGMTPTIHVPAMLNFQVNGRWMTRPVTAIGIDAQTQDQAGDFGKYLQHPENRRKMSFELRDGGYDIRDHQAGPAAEERWVMEEAGWPWRRERIKYERNFESIGRRHDAPPEYGDAEVDGGQAAIDGRTADATAAGEVVDAPSGEDAENHSPPVIDPFANRAGQATAEKKFDPLEEQYTGLVLGIALSSFRDSDGKERFLILPGDDVRLTFPTAGSPPQAASRFLTVVDFYESKMSEYDSNFVFLPIHELQKWRGMVEGEVGFVNSIQIKLRDENDADLVRDELRKAFAMDTYSVLTWRDKQGPLLAAVQMESAILNVLLFLIIAVAGFGILAIFFMIVVEKTRDIGILKALGASGRGIMGIFLAYGLSLGTVGSGAGMVLGLLFVVYINEIADLIGRITGQPVFSPEIYYFYKIPTIIDPFTVGWIVCGAMAIAVLASVLPARRAARLHPVEALRYE